MLAQIRAFFLERNVLEVETPILYSSTATDLQLSSFTSYYLDTLLFLQTSPEFPMKRLLAAGSGPIYQISKTFRDGESGRWHNPEFTMLEWYRPGFDDYTLMDEMEELLVYILLNKNKKRKKIERLSYKHIFQYYLDINPHRASLNELIACAEKKGLIINKNTMDRDNYLDLLMSHYIEPYLGTDYPVFITDFPASQAGLAKVRELSEDGASIFLAERFEVYIQGMEIANAYHELTNPQEQGLRFEQNNEKRKKLGLPIIPIDFNLLAALEHGLPESAGAALGIDRLVFLVAKSLGHPVQAIRDVLSFPIDCV